MEITHGEFAVAGIDGIAPAEPYRIALGYGAPVAAPLEDRHHMIVIAQCLEIEKDGRLAMEHQGPRCDKGRLDAVTAAMAQRQPGRVA